jgi:transposase
MWCCAVSFGAASWRSSFAELPPCLVGMEACGSAHHWARVIGSYGHEVRLMPPAYVKPYVKRNKNDGRDAEACCEAVGRPTMRFVAVKSVEQQATLSVHSTRAMLRLQRTMAANALRAGLSEIGIVAAQGYKGLRELIARLERPDDEIPPMNARSAVGVGQALAGARRR